MKLNFREIKDVSIIDISGRITIGEGDIKLRDAIHKLLKENKRKIILNFAEATYIDSAGIGELVSAYTSAKRNNAQLKLINLTKKIHDILQITHLLTVFETFDNEEAAVKSF